MGKDNKERQSNFKKLVIDTAISEYINKSDTIAIGTKQFVYNANRKAKYHKENKNISYRQRGI